MLYFFVAPWTLTCQAPLSMGFPRQEWSRLLFPFAGDLLNPGIEPPLADGFFITKPPREILKILFKTTQVSFPQGRFIRFPLFLYFFFTMYICICHFTFVGLLLGICLSLPPDCKFYENRHHIGVHHQAQCLTHN